MIDPFGAELSSLISLSGTDIANNEMKVGTQHVRRVRELTARKYGLEAPSEVVVFEKRGIEL